MRVAWKECIEKNGWTEHSSFTFWHAKNIPLISPPETQKKKQRAYMANDLIEATNSSKVKKDAKSITASVWGAFLWLCCWGIEEGEREITI